MRRKKGKWTDNVAVSKINQQFRDKRKDIIHNHGADNFAGAWNTLSGEEKLGALGFSAVTSVVAGGLTYAIMNSSRKRGGGGKGGKGDGKSSGCSGGGGAYGCSSGHGHGGGHGCGIGGCGGGGCGGGS